MEARLDGSQGFNVGFVSDAQESASFGQTVEIEVGFARNDAFTCGFNDDDGFTVDFGNGESGEVYHGAYEVTPTSSEQYLYTANSILTQNVTVHATPYAEVSNEEGGYTATIL